MEDWMARQGVDSRSLPTSTLLVVFVFGLLGFIVACRGTTNTAVTPESGASTSSAVPTANPDIGLQAETFDATTAAELPPAAPATTTANPDTSMTTTEGVAPLESVPPQSQPTLSTPTALVPPATDPAATATPTPTRKVGYNVGEQAPDFVLRSVTGETYSVSEVVGSGKSVLLYFFATW